MKKMKGLKKQRPAKQRERRRNAKYRQYKEEEERPS